MITSRLKKIIARNKHKIFYDGEITSFCCCVFFTVARWSCFSFKKLLNKNNYEDKLRMTLTKKLALHGAGLVNQRER